MLPTHNFSAVLRVNLSASFYLAQAVIAPMTGQGYGRIVNVGGLRRAFPAFRGGQLHHRLGADRRRRPVHGRLTGFVCRSGRVIAAGSKSTNAKVTRRLTIEAAMQL